MLPAPVTADVPVWQLCATLLLTKALPLDISTYTCIRRIATTSSDFASSSVNRPLGRAVFRVLSLMFICSLTFCNLTSDPLLLLKQLPGR